MPFLFFVLPQDLGMFIYMVFSYRGIFLYIYSIDTPFLFSFSQRYFSIYIQYLIYCLDFPYMYRNTMYFPIYIQYCLYRPLFLFLPCPDFPYIYGIYLYIYNKHFFFSLFFPEMCISLYSFSYRYFLYITKGTSFFFFISPRK